MGVRRKVTASNSSDRRLRSDGHTASNSMDFFCSVCSAANEKVWELNVDYIRNSRGFVGKLIVHDSSSSVVWIRIPSVH